MESKRELLEAIRKAIATNQMLLREQKEMIAALYAPATEEIVTISIKKRRIERMGSEKLHWIDDYGFISIDRLDPLSDSTESEQP